MAATRLSDSQKQELVARFRLGETSLVLAEAFGCSTNTVSRVVRTALDPQEYEALKQQQRGRGSAQVVLPAGGSGGLVPLADAGADFEAPAANPLGEAEAGTAQAFADLEPPAPSSPGGGPWEAALTEPPGLGAPDPDHDPEDQDSPSDDPGHAALAIDDADDFADEAGEDDDEGDSPEEGDDGGDDGDDRFQGHYGADRDGQTFVVLPLGQTIEDRPSLSVQPLVPADLPTSVYMLVDKTVELDIKPLKDLPELGTLPEGEAERQALVVYANPRQAKRYCGRNQRVIKVPDSGVLARTAPFLLSQGVTRLVVEGALYSLPGS